MRLRSLWIGLFLALCAMQAHAWLHTDHDASAADPTCLSCKLQAELGSALPLAAIVLLPLATSLASPPARARRIVGGYWPQPLGRGPPGPL